MKNLKKKFSLLLLTASLSALSVVNSFASSDAPNFSEVTTAISGAGTSVMSEGIKVIGAALSLGVLFWGAQLLWSKFRTMSSGKGA